MDWTRLDSFCAAPWLHSHVDTVGTRRLCCIAGSAPEGLSSATHAEFANSGYMKAIRRQMMSGVLPDECASCAVPVKKEVYRHYFNSRFGHHLDAIRGTTEDDGSTSAPIVSLDYRAHTCNLKCRTCGPWSSSAWLNHRKGDPRGLPTIFPGTDLHVLEQSIGRSPYKREFLEIVSEHPIEEMYFAGGEPLASPEHHRVLDHLIESGRCREIHLAYNTNLSLGHAQIEKWIARIRHFRSVYIGCSIDGTREVAEYIRTGLEFDRFEANLRTIIAARAEHPHLSIALDPTMTSLFLLDLKEFCELALSHGLPVTTKLMIGNDEAAGYLRCEFLPQHIRARLIGEWRRYHASLPEASQGLLGSLASNLELAERVASFPPGQVQASARQAMRVDEALGSRVRFGDFLERDDGVHAWWRSIVEPRRADSMTDAEFSVLEEFLGSFHDFFRQLLGVLYVLQPPHTNNDVIKALPRDGRLTGAELAHWRVDPEQGLLHGLVTAYFAVKLASGWAIPEIRANASLQRLIASCLLHDCATVAGDPDGPRVNAHRIERREHVDLPHDRARFEVWAFHTFIRPALAKLFRARTAVWLRHGAEEADWRAMYPRAAMVSRSKELWPNFYYRWPGFPDYWAVEVGELSTGIDRPHLVDHYFPAGLITIDDYRASADGASILSAPGREHEIAHGAIPLARWIFVLEESTLSHHRSLVTQSGGFVTYPIFTNLIDVADTLYAKLHAIG